MNLCKCGDVYKNTGFKRCPTKKAPKIGVLVPYLGSDGTVNRIDVAAYALLSDSAKKAYFVAKLNAPDPADRWYPIEVKNPTSTRAASDFFTFADKSKEKIRAGIRNFGLVIQNGSPQVQAKLEAFGCSEAFGILINDVAGNLIGQETEEGFLEPFPIDPATWDVIAQWAEGDNPSWVGIQFDFLSSMNDSDERMLSASDLAPVNIYQIFKMGLFDVFPDYGTNSTTSIVVTLKLKDGSLLDNGGAKGLVIADFVSSVTAATSKVRNKTTNADVTITSVTVASDGITYTLNFAAQTAGDEFIVKPLKNGFDFSEVEATTTTL